MGEIFEYGLVCRKGEMHFRAEVHSAMEEQALREIAEYPYEAEQGIIAFSFDHETSKVVARNTGVETITIPLHITNTFEALPCNINDTSKIFIFAKDNIYTEGKQQIEQFISALLWYYNEVYLIRLEPVDEKSDGLDPALSDAAFARAFAKKVQYAHDEDTEKHIRFPWIVRRIKAE